MAYTIEQIAEALGAKALGASDLEIDGSAEPVDATAPLGAGDETGICRAPDWQ